jgi:4-hydroxy-3-methylbut-2-en-1-yl diphosphate reductase
MTPGKKRETGQAMMEKKPYTAQRFKLNRRGFGLRKEIAAALDKDYRSDLIAWLRKNDHCLAVDDVTFILAREFGFCYGVDGAIEIAYETRRKFPDRRIIITTEIIHNPRVNLKLCEMGIEFLSGQYSKGLMLDDITERDVVILPAFGAHLGDLENLSKKNCILVDTTCASVMNVWKRVEQYAREGITALIHGKHYHEETRATASRVNFYADAQYLIILNRKETQKVCDYILNGGDKTSFLADFENAFSEGFDPDIHLARIGVANQTTMLSSESQAIADMLQTALIEHYGDKDIAERFKKFETICSSTQQRQDAMLDMANHKPDLILVVGGYNSSNTNHLAEMGSEMVSSYHISQPDCILSCERIRHKPAGDTQEVETENWLPPRPVRIGLTAGASTPDRVVADTIERVCEVCGLGSPSQLLHTAKSDSTK